MADSFDRWPRLMRRDTAAAYCDMTPEQFDRHFPLPAKDQGWRGLRWDRADIDRWIENLPEKPSKSSQNDESRLDCADQPVAGGASLLTSEDRRKASLARI